MNIVKTDCDQALARTLRIGTGGRIIRLDLDTKQPSVCAVMKWFAWRGDGMLITAS